MTRDKEECDSGINLKGTYLSSIRRFLNNKRARGFKWDFNLSSQDLCGGIGPIPVIF